MQTTVFRRSLLRYIRTGKTSAGEMAHVVDVTAQHIRAVAREDRHLSPDKMARLSSWLVDELGLTAHLEGFLGMNGEVHFAPENYDNSDDIRPEIMDLRNDATGAIEALDNGNREEAARQLRDAIGDAHEALQDVQNPAN